VYLGIDGEGQGRDEHKYVFLACSNESGERRWSIRAPPGERLSTEDCLDFILSLPGNRHKVFAYAFGYDLTKILTDVPSGILYKLFRPEERQRQGKDARKGPYPVLWNGYRINLQASKFTVQRGKRRIVIWDIFKFFQGKFVSAIQDWKVGNKELWERMAHMKDQRGDFDKLDPEAVQEYCFEECSCMAGLARKLTEAHVAAGLTLRNYYGAGSSAAAMLQVMGVKEAIAPAPMFLRKAIAKAFFGGRFENSVIGSVERRLWGYDISSAYPYELCFLPCQVHGVWEKTRDRRALEQPDIGQAIVRYTIGPWPGSSLPAWGPFPFREDTGNISFPIESGGGWVYLDEYLAGEKLFPNVRFREALVFHVECDCKPFAKIPEYYKERLRIGKEGPGIVIKLGCNSCYGKLAQSIGNAPFQSWLWAGMITSGTRAKLLSMLGLVQDWSSILMMATDGIVSSERIRPPYPKDTGTYTAHKTEKPDEFLPLGGWEEKEVPQGMFFARPGIYFPLRPTKKQLTSVRGRGVGRKAILDNWETIVQRYHAMGSEELGSAIVPISEVSRFCGVKSSISKSYGRDGSPRFTRADGRDPDGTRRARVSPSYGQWIVRPVEMTFDPHPKRDGIGDASFDGDCRQLTLRKFSRTLRSFAYDRARSEETLELKEASLEMLEQPDADMTEVW
jgi:DNA polymerase type B, organellar and viral